VAAAWAVAATGIAVLAFLTASDDDEARLADSASQVGRVERELDRRLAAFEERLDTFEGPTLTQIRTRLEDVGAATVRSDERLPLLTEKVARLERRNATLQQELENLQTFIEAGGDDATP
jgi:hypothetical protein